MFGKVEERMRKRIFAGVLATAMVASLLTGCSSSRTTKHKVSEVDVDSIDFKTNLDINTKDDIELTVWESAEGPDEFIEKAGEYFTKLYPNIKIKYVNVESTDANSKIVLDGPSGTGADVFACAHDTIGVMAASGAIEPVPDSEKEIVAGSCLESALQGATLNESDGSSVLYGYPVSVETYALFYNKALISKEEIPTTMEDMMTYMTEFKADSKNDGKQPFLFDAGNAYYSVMFTSTPDIHLYGENGNDVTNTYMNSADSVKQMEDFVALSKIVGQNTGDIDYKHNDSLFAAGSLAMDISGAWNIKTFEESKIDFGITAIPSLSGSTQPPTNFMGVRCMFVSKYSKHIPEAQAFAEFLMTKEMQQLRCEITCTMPARDDVLDNITDDTIKEYMNGLNEQIQYSYPMPNMANASLFWSAFGSAYSNIWNGIVTDIQKELDTANKSATKNK